MLLCEGKKKGSMISRLRKFMQFQNFISATKGTESELRFILLIEYFNQHCTPNVLCAFRIFSNFQIFYKCTKIHNLR